MGRFHGGNRPEMGFPDEFGVDLCQAEQDQKPTGANQNPLPPQPFCGYIAADWFGPFLLSPPRRGERGWC
jgi:hypothetical protein